MASLTGACLALFAAMVAMTHVAAIRDSYDEGSARLSVSEDQDYEKVKYEKELWLKLSVGDIMSHYIYGEGTDSFSRRLRFEDFGMEVTESMLVSAIWSKARQNMVQLGWRLTKVKDQLVNTLEELEAELSDRPSSGRVFFETSEAVNSSVGNELEEFAIDVTSDFDLAKYGVEIDGSGILKAVPPDSSAAQRGITFGGGKTRTLMWMGGEKVSGKQDIDRIFDENRRWAGSQSISNGNYMAMAASVRMQVTFLTVPSTSKAAVPDDSEGADVDEENQPH